MKAREPRDPVLPDAGRRIERRPGVGIALRVVQEGGLRLSSVFVEQPGLSFVRRGEKRVRVGAFDALVREGEAVALPSGLSLEVTNVADEAGRYEALSVIPDAALIAAGRSEDMARPMRTPVHLSRLDGGFAEAVQRAISAIFEPSRIPDQVAAARMREVLAWLASVGITFEASRPTMVAARTRLLLTDAPGRRWTGPEVAQTLAMSEATLRRRLAAERTTLSDLLVEVRMSTALVLLQATEKSVAEIAFDVGYESASRFAARFRRRFGHPPAAIRHGDPDLDRHGAEIDRHGSAASPPG